MTNSLKESAEITRERIRAAADSASERAAHVRETAGERANSAYSNVRERGSRIVDRVRERPLTAIIDGLAVGVLAAALIPALRNRSVRAGHAARSEEHTSELQSLLRISYAVFSLKK